MNKTTRILTILAVMPMLASCGKTLTRAEAIDNLNKSAEHVESSSYKAPTKLTFSATTTDEDGSDVNEIAFDADAHYLSIYEKSGSEGDYSVYFQEGDKAYLVEADDKNYTNGTYTVIPSVSRIDAAIKEIYGANAGSAFLRTLATELKAMGEQAESQEASATASVEGLTIAKNTFKENYTSSGEGNLSIEFLLDYDATYKGSLLGTETTTRTVLYMSTKVTMDDFKPKSVKAESKFDLLGLKGEEKSEMTYNWGSCNIAKPDISKLKAK
ncbi:MAG: hypothetical protein K6B65_07040 [Bacilli bacterium]|nr:hypothetical protein [Bacilli bacterium]